MNSDLGELKVLYNTKLVAVKPSDEARLPLWSASGMAVRRSALLGGFYCCHESPKFAFVQETFGTHAGTKIETEWSNRADRLAYIVWIESTSKKYRNR